jgi:hypothetical protein
MYDGVDGDDGGGGGGGGSGGCNGFLPTGADSDSARVENGKSTLALDSGLSATCTYSQGCGICAKSVVKCNRPVLLSAALPTVPTHHADVTGTSTGNQIKLLFMLVAVVSIRCVVGWLIGWMIGCLFVCVFVFCWPPLTDQCCGSGSGGGSSSGATGMLLGDRRESGSRSKSSHDSG